MEMQGTKWKIIRERKKKKEGEERKKKWGDDKRGTQGKKKKGPVTGRTWETGDRAFADTGPDHESWCLRWQDGGPPACSASGVRLPKRVIGSWHVYNQLGLVIHVDVGLYYNRFCYLLIGYINTCLLGLQQHEFGGD